MHKISELRILNLHMVIKSRYSFFYTKYNGHTVMNVKKSNTDKAVYFPEISRNLFEELIKEAKLDIKSSFNKISLNRIITNSSSFRTIYESDIPFQPFYLTSGGDYLPIKKFMNDSKKTVRIAIVPESEKESFILPNSNGSINPETRLIFVRNSSYVRVEYSGRLKDQDLDNLDPSNYRLSKDPTKGFVSKKYNFAGGSVIHGEDLRQAAIRELYEETGIKINEDNSNFVLLSSLATIDKSLRNNLFIYFVNDEQINNLHPIENDVASIHSAKIVDLRKLKKLYGFSYMDIFAVHLRVFIFGRGEKLTSSPTSSCFIRNSVFTEIVKKPIKTKKSYPDRHNKDDFLHNSCLKNPLLISKADCSTDWRIKIKEIFVN